MWSTDNLNPLHFDTFEDFLKTKKRFEDVDDIFDKNLNEKEERKEMEKLWFVRYDDEPLTKHEQFVLDYETIQDSFEKDFFGDKLRDSDKLFHDSDYTKPFDQVEIPSNWSQKNTKESQIFQFLKCLDTRYMKSDACITKGEEKKEIKLLGIAIWMFCVGKIKWKFIDEKYIQKIQDFLENTAFQNKDLVKLKKLFIKLSQSK